jgi:chorismate mutase
MKELLELRDSLDKIDKSIIELVAQRFEVTKNVGLLKKEHNLPSTDSSREQSQMENIRAFAETQGLAPDIAEKVLRLLIDETVRNHNKLKEGRFLTEK